MYTSRPRGPRARARGHPGSPGTRRALCPHRAFALGVVAQQLPDQPAALDGPPGPAADLRPAPRHAGHRGRSRTEPEPQHRTPAARRGSRRSPGRQHGRRCPCAGRNHPRCHRVRRVPRYLVPASGSGHVVADHRFSRAYGPPEPVAAALRRQGRHVGGHRLDRDLLGPTPSQVAHIGGVLRRPRGHRHRPAPGLPLHHLGRVGPGVYRRSCLRRGHRVRGHACEPA